jgi:hypothetical protein
MKITVYIVGFEADPEEGGISGFNWYPYKDAADKGFEKTQKDLEGCSDIIYRGELNVDVSEDYSGTEEQREEVTRKVELFLEENEWENAFK